MGENSIRVQLAPGAAEIGLALMIKDLIGQNLEQNPQKVKDFTKLNLEVGLIVADVDIEITMAFSTGTLLIHPGISAQAGIVIQTEADIVMAMSNVTIRCGLPYYLDETGRELIQAMLNGRLKIKGMIFHLPSLIRLSRIMSIHP